MTSFCGFAVYQVQRISIAQQARVTALSNQSLLLCMRDLIISMSHDDRYASYDIEISGRNINKVLRTRVAEIGADHKTLAVELIGKHGRSLTALYLFFSRKNANEAWLYRGMQFGNSL